MNTCEFKPGCGCEPKICPCGIAAVDCDYHKPEALIEEVCKNEIDPELYFWGTKPWQYFVVAMSMPDCKMLISNTQGGLPILCVQGSQLEYPNGSKSKFFDLYYPGEMVRLVP